MRDIIDLDAYPIDHPDSSAYQALVANCKDELARDGMFSLAGFVHPHTADSLSAALLPRYSTESFRHARAHNIYFEKSIPDLPADHPALAEVETVNHTLCADQLDATALHRLYEFQPFIDFLAAVMDKPALYRMDDALARFIAMAYYPGDALNWHFDRSEFTTTLLLQAPDQGGAFQYRPGLRSEDDPNYDGVARLLRGQDPELKELVLTPGTLNVFLGRNTAHRVTPVAGDKARLVAVLGYYETPGVAFSASENLGFYGRTA